MLDSSTADAAAFRVFCREQVRRRLEQTCLFAFTFFSIAWVIGRLVLSGHELERPGRFWLGVLTLLSFSSWLLFRYLPLAKRYPTPFALLVTMSISACAATHTSIMSDLDGPFFYAVYILPPISIGLALELPERILMTLAAPFAWVFAYFGTNPTYLEHPMLHVPCIILTGALMVSVFLGHHLYRVVRDRFMLNRHNDRQRIELERHSARLEQEVEHSSEALDRLGRVLAETSVDREDVARALHDDLGQLIIGVRMELSTLEQRLELLPESRRGARLDHLSTVVETLDQSVRSFIHRLRNPQPIGDLGASLEELVEPLRRRSRMTITTDVAVESELDAKVRETLYRLVQEAVTNVFKHAGAERIDIVIREDENGLVAAEVRDDGMGFDADSSFAGHGIRGLRERAERFAGLLVIESSSDGTTVRMELPPAHHEATG